MTGTNATVAELEPASTRQQILDLTTVLVPAAGIAAGTTGGAMGAPTNAALAPMAGRPVIQWTIEHLAEVGLRRFVVAVPTDDTIVADLLHTLFDHDVDIEVLHVASSSLGETIEHLVDACHTPRALVVLGDTYFQFADDDVLATEVPTVLTCTVDDSYRWSTVETVDGSVTVVHDKVPGLPAPVEALIGVYAFPSLADLRDAVRSVPASRDRTGRPDGARARGRRAADRQGPTAMAEILAHFVDTTGLRAVRAGRWFDAGNADHRSRSSRTLLAQRAFNSLTIDDVMGTITKRSTNVAKFVDEIAYVLGLPRDLAALFPRVLDHSLELDDPWIEMEFYGYPTLAELFVYGRLDPSIWHTVFEHLHVIVSERFGAHRRPVTADSVRAMYLDKVRDRLDVLRAEPRLSLVLDRPEIVVNGVALANLPALWDRLEHEVDRLARTVDGTAIHGDLCLSNILYELSSGVCRLLDPRGSFGPSGHAGDPRYDAAKLWHSVHGGYDLIVADLFTVSMDELGTATLDVRERPEHRAAAGAFEQVFFRTFDRRDITIVTGLIFCSIPALHYDRPDRQLAMYLRGLQLLDEALADR